ncbi:MAG: ABC transporter permease subunit [bacterium]|nr:ABC transporter permease subunit [bacterium]
MGKAIVSQKGTAKKKKNFWLQVRKNHQLLTMLIPALILVILFSYIPMGGIVIAFKKYNYGAGIFGSAWNGIDNFRFLFISGKIWTLTRNTLLYNIAFISVGLVFEVGFAVMLNEMRGVAFKKVAQSFMFLPHFISWVVAATIMLNIFGTHGVLNSIIKSLGGESFNIYAQTKQWPIVMILLKVWKSAGYGCVVYLAAIVGINPEIYEAAKIDGANIWQRIFRIILPNLKPTIIIMTLLAVGGIFRGDFGMFYQIVGSNQLLLESSDIIDTFVYRSMMSNSNMGMTAAAGLYQSVLCFITINLVNFTVKKIDPDYSLY